MQCSLYKLDGDSMFHVNSKAESFVFCGTCDKMENHVDFEGEQLMRFQIKDAWWCRKKCMLTDGCNAMSFQASGGWCTLKHVLPEFKRSKKTGTKSYLFCDGAISCSTQVLPASLLCMVYMLITAVDALCWEVFVCC